MVRVKNWFITSNQDGYTPPELVRNYLCGNAYGHPRFHDGDPVTSSPIMGVADWDVYKIVETANTEYIVYPEEVDREYDKAFPNAFKRLSARMKN